MILYHCLTHVFNKLSSTIINFEQSPTALGQVVQGILLCKLLQLCKNNRNASCNDRLRELKASRDNINVTKRIVYNILYEASLVSYLPIRKPLLQNNRKKQRLQFYKERLAWLKEAWERVIFTNECCRPEVFPRR